MCLKGDRSATRNAFHGSLRIYRIYVLILRPDIKCKTISRCSCYVGQRRCYITGSEILSFGILKGEYLNSARTSDSALGSICALELHQRLILIGDLIAVFVLCVINLDYSLIRNGIGNGFRICFIKNVSRILICGVDSFLVNSQDVVTNPNILLHRLRIVFIFVLVVLNAVRCFLGGAFVLGPLCIEVNIFLCHGEGFRICGSFAICLRIPRSKLIPRLGKRVLLNSYSCTRDISLCIGDCIAAIVTIAVIGHAVSRNCNFRRFGQLGFAILAICQTCILCIICSCNIGRIIMRTALPRCACRICCDIEFQLQLITLPVTILINNQITLVRIVKSGNFNGLSL